MPDSGMRILIVDDEPLVRSDLRYLLEHHGEWAGCMLDELEDGLAAQGRIRALWPDIVITDIRMPNMDGLMLMQQFRDDPGAPVFIVISGYSDFSYATQALRCGAADYLLKPIDEDQFYLAMRRASEMMARRRVYREGDSDTARAERPKPAVAWDEEALAHAEARCRDTIAQLLRAANYSALSKDAGRAIGHLLHGPEMAAADIAVREATWARLCQAVYAQCGRDQGPQPLLSDLPDASAACAHLLEVIATRPSDRALSDPRSTMWAVRQYLDANYMKPLTLTGVADRYGLNPNYMSTLFREVTGAGFVEYLTQTRLEQAKLLLMESMMSASRIAELVGFSSQPYFQRVFKDKLGMTPQQFRRAAQAGRA